MTCQETQTGFNCEKGKEITISSPNDPTNPLTVHNWTVDGSQISTQPKFTQTFPNTGSHQIVHTGQNACGSSCSQATQLEVVDVVTPPTPATAAPAGVSPLVIAAVVALGFLGIVMMKKTK